MVPCRGSGEVLGHGVGGTVWGTSGKSQALGTWAFCSVNTGFVFFMLLSLELWFSFDIVKGSLVAYELGLIWMDVSSHPLGIGLQLEASGARVCGVGKEQVLQPETHPSFV